MKYLIFIGLLFSLTIRAQDQSVDELPAEASPAGAATEYLYLLDGSTDKHITLATVFGVIGDTADVVRGELIDSIYAAEDRITEGGVDLFTETTYPTGTFYPTETTDNWHIGQNTSTTYKFKVTGQAYATTGLLVPTSIGVYLGTSYLYEDALSTNHIKFNIAGTDRASLTSNGTGTNSGLFSCDYFYSSATSYGVGPNEGTFYYNSTANAILVYDGSEWDTLGAGGLSQYMSDSLYLTYLNGATNGTRFLVPTVTGAVDTGTLVNAAYGLVKDLKPLGVMLRDQKNGEILWNFPAGKSRYGIGGSGLEGITAIASKVEESLRYVYRELIHNRIQYGLILLLIVWCIRLELKLRKREK